jgi:hypothetical protein
MIAKRVVVAALLTMAFAALFASTASASQNAGTESEGLCFETAASEQFMKEHSKTQAEAHQVYQEQIAPTHCATIYAPEGSGLAWDTAVKAAECLSAEEERTGEETTTATLVSCVMSSLPPNLVQNGRVVRQKRHRGVTFHIRGNHRH